MNRDTAGKLGTPATASPPPPPQATSCTVIGHSKLLAIFVLKCHRLLTSLTPPPPPASSLDQDVPGRIPVRLSCRNRLASPHSASCWFLESLSISGAVKRKWNETHGSSIERCPTVWSKEKCLYSPKTSSNLLSVLVIGEFTWDKNVNCYDIRLPVLILWSTKGESCPRVQPHDVWSFDYEQAIDVVHSCEFNRCANCHLLDQRSQVAKQQEEVVSVQEQQQQPQVVTASKSNGTQQTGIWKEGGILWSLIKDSRCKCASYPVVCLGAFGSLALCLGIILCAVGSDMLAVGLIFAAAGAVMIMFFCRLCDVPRQDYNTLNSDQPDRLSSCSGVALPSPSETESSTCYSPPESKSIDFPVLAGDGSPTYQEQSGELPLKTTGSFHINT
ncbi:uncharacterized protein [Procambarus clarkii]|uniref:uncharacterized protein n=1 Tax=Procambarus clarkii TaxID=6728 RepID=UPI0037432BCF